MKFISSVLRKYPSEEPLSPCCPFPAHLPQSKTNNPPSHRMGIPSGKPDLPPLSRLYHPFPVPVKFTLFLYPVYQPHFFLPSADLGRFAYSSHHICGNMAICAYLSHQSVHLSSASQSPAPPFPDAGYGISDCRQGSPHRVEYCLLSNHSRLFPVP